MSKSTNTASSSSKTATVKPVFEITHRDLPELEEMACETGDSGDILELSTVMYRAKYFDFMNDILNTALKAAGVESKKGSINFAKLYCVNCLSYSVHCFVDRESIQKKITKDILGMNENPNDELSGILSHFSDFCDLIDPGETGMLNVSDEQLKEYMTVK